MRMSDSCRKPKTSRELGPATAGFTLLEILVVLTMVGLLAAASLPQFTVIRDRLAFTLDRESFEKELAGLSYLAFKEGRALILAGQYPRRANDVRSSADGAFLTEDEPLFLEPGQLRPVRPPMASEATLNLPEEWRVTIANPIIYQPSGYCSGGTVNLLIGQLKYVYDLKAPTCQGELEK